MKILIINGPNLNMLGTREPELYGQNNYAALEAFIYNTCEELGVTGRVMQSNHEGVIVDEIQSAYGDFDAIVLNAAAYTHTSVAILDALKAVGLPAVEVHLTDIYSREQFRHISYPSLYCEKTVCGKGFDGYREAIEHLVNKYAK